MLGAYRVFGLDQHGFMSSGGDVFLHDAAVIKATQQEAKAVHPQVEVHLLTHVPAQPYYSPSE